MALKSDAMPNLKIEVANNDPRDEAMDVDGEGSKEESLADEASELEEGEISDSKDDDDTPTVRPYRSAFSRPEKEHEPEFERRYENKSGAFVTGIDIFSKEGQEKLNERAKRFGLDPSKVKPLTEAQLRQLYESLGLKDDESPLEKQGHRLDALHFRGTDNMSTQDVFDYFKDYGPASIEWINDVSCNVVWLDKLSPARALLGLTRPISGLTQSGKQKMEEVVLVEEEDGEIEEEDMTEAPAAATEDNQSAEKQMETPEKGTEDEAVPASEINAPIPPGMWRLGAQCLKAKCILLRFATRADRKPKQAEKMSEYYKKYGNPNYGGIRGIISSSRKRKYHSDKHYDPRPLPPDMYDEDPESNKNPWGSLAQNWGTMDRSHVQRGFVDPDDPLLLDAPVQQRVILRSNRSNPPPPPPTVYSSESEHNSSSESEDDSDKWRKKLKGPHMRMYADEEEVKIKKRKLNARLGRKTSPPPAPTVDLRARLSKPVRTNNKGSVWSRLEATKVVEPANSVALPSDEEWSSDDDKSVVVTTVKSQVSDLRHALSSSRKKDGSDLRSRLDTRKKRRSPKSTPPYEKSPLRIEINNDEYVQSQGSSSEAGSAASGSGSSNSSSDSESGSSSGSSSSSSSSSESSSSSGEEEEEAEKSS